MTATFHADMMRFKVDSDMGRLWLELKDQRVHNRAAVLALLASHDPEDRLKWFKHNGRFPRVGQAYRYDVHDDGKKICIAIQKIAQI